MTATGIVIRDAVLEEASSILALWRSSFETEDTHGDVHDVERVISDDQNVRLLVAVVDGKPVGSLIVTFDGWRGNLYRLAVLPRYQRQAIARTLVGVAEAWLQTVGGGKISALVERNNLSAQAFWAEAGYGQEEQMLRYTKSLPSN